MNFGKYLKTKRKEKNLSMNKLAVLTGVTAMYISQLESGKRENPSIEVLKKLTISLEVPYENLLEAAGYFSIEKAGYKEEIEAFLSRKHEILTLPEKHIDDLEFLLSSENEIYFEGRLLTKPQKIKIIKMIEIILED